MIVCPLGKFRDDFTFYLHRVLAFMHPGYSTPTNIQQMPSTYFNHPTPYTPANTLIYYPQSLSPPSHGDVPVYARERILLAGLTPQSRIYTGRISDSDAIFSALRSGISPSSYTGLSGIRTRMVVQCIEQLSTLP